MSWCGQRLCLPQPVTDGAFNTGHAVMAQAVELCEELDRLGHEWDGLSDSWPGVAASAYTSAWQDWHDGATKLLNTLPDLSEKLCRATVDYEQTDGDAAGTLGAAGAQI
jgi:WXG100 family type VII secretion target